jgi:hypothetical protein
MATTLGDLVQITSGHPFRGRIEPNRDGDVYVVQMRNIDTEGVIDVEQLTQANSVSKDRVGMLRPNDILFLAKGSNNVASLVEGLPENSVCSPQFFHMRVRVQRHSDVLAEYICWQLNQLPAQRYFKTSAEGTHQVSIRKKVLADTPFVLPDIQTQAYIANMHRCAMKEIKIHKQLIENRQQQMMAIASDLLNRFSKNS